jgi:hypothetical protein
MVSATSWVYAAMLSAGIVAPVLLSVLGGFLSLAEQKIDVSRPTVMLGSTDYDMKAIVAPVLSGSLLEAFSYVATKTPFGFVLRRFLLLDNGITKLRELAAQMPEGVPMHHPMYRLKHGAEKDAHAAKVAEAESLSVTLDDFVPFVTSPNSPFNSDNSNVLRMHAAFQTGATTPSDVTAKLLRALPSLQDAYRMFSSHPLAGEMEAAARLSDARYAAKAPLSIWDGVPVAFKDMIPLKVSQLQFAVSGERLAAAFRFPFMCASVWGRFVAGGGW